MAFQIKDDLFDYSEDAIGKPELTSKNKKWLCLYSCFEYVYFKRENMAYQFY
jgi:geranylgeranyl pyrophosphate synthase